MGGREGPRRRGSPACGARGGAPPNFTEIGARGSIRGAAWPGRTISAYVNYRNRLCGVAADGARRVAEEAALRGGTRRRGRGSAVLGTGKAATGCVCKRSTTGSQNRGKARRSAAAEIPSWWICGTRGGDSSANGAPASGTVYSPLDLAQQEGQGRVPLTGGPDQTEMSCGGFVGEDQRSRRAALAETSPGDASGLLDLMVGRGRLR